MAEHNQFMNTKVLRAAIFSLLALSIAAGCTTGARGAENVPVVEASPNYQTHVGVVREISESCAPPEVLPGNQANLSCQVVFTVTLDGENDSVIGFTAPVLPENFGTWGLVNSRDLVGKQVEVVENSIDPEIFNFVSWRVIDTPKSVDELPEGYEHPDRTVRLSGHEIVVEPTETRLVADDLGLPLIYAMSEGLLIQFYGSSTCPLGISLEIDHFGTTALGTDPAIRSDEFLKVVVNQNYAMELDPQLMACSADLNAQTYRIFAVQDANSESLPVIDWQSVAELARWSYIHDPETEGGMERDWGPFAMSTGISN